MSDEIEENIRYKLYICLYGTTNGEIDHVESKIIFIFQRMDERGRLFRARQRLPEAKKYLAKEMKGYILMSRLINRETWLHDLGGFDVSYHSETPFEQLE